VGNNPCFFYLKRGEMMGNTIKDSLYFSLNNVSCRNFGLMQVNLSGGLFEEQLHANRNIIETKVANNDTPLFHGVEESPLEFDMMIAFEDEFTDNDINDVVLWLFQENYKELIFDNKPDKVFMAMVIGDSNLIHNGLKNGYITLRIRCKSSNINSPVITTDTYHVVGTQQIVINNSGHKDIYPEISITNATGEVKIVNETISTDIFKLTDMIVTDDIYINCQKEIVETGVTGYYIYDRVFGNYPRLIKGINTLKITGNCDIQLRYRLKYKF
jgi:phage-related protein